jgi:hypothetical protein
MPTHIIDLPAEILGRLFVAAQRTLDATQACRRLLLVLPPHATGLKLRVTQKRQDETDYTRMSQLTIRRRFVYSLLTRFGRTKRLSFEFFVPQFSAGGKFFVEYAQALQSRPSTFATEFERAILATSIDASFKSCNEKAAELHNGCTAMMMSDLPFLAERLVFSNLSYHAAHVLTAKCSTTLRTLELAKNAFFDREDVAEFADVLRGGQFRVLDSLSIVDRSFNMDLHRDAIPAFSLMPILCSAIAACPSLQHITIDCAPDEPEAYADLSRALALAPNLERLGITIDVDDFLSATATFLSAAPFRGVVPHLHAFSVYVETVEDWNRLAAVLPSCSRMKTLEILSSTWEKPRFEQARNVVLAVARQHSIDVVVDAFADMTDDESDAE